MDSDRKVFSLDQLLALRQSARQAGKTVVHCHGCFDIVHPGHIMHLEYARSLGDILIVSVSADGKVNKGVDRPLIPDGLRAASLAALQCVEWVYINPDPTAQELLDRLAPDVYVKGKEYETNADPRFLAERDTVLRHGGRVVFSSGDLVYSSTTLINQLDPGAFHDEKISRFRQQHGLTGAMLQHLIHRMRGMKVTVVGDYIQDRYRFCEATGVAGEGPMLALRDLNGADFDGGAAVIALHAAGLGADVTLVTDLPAHDEGALLRLRQAGVALHSVAQRKNIVRKTRFLVDQNKLFKVDEGAPAPLDSRAQQAAASAILSAGDGADAVIFADFGYGMLSASLLDQVLWPLRERANVIAADVSGRQTNLLHFKNVDLLCPTERELRDTLHDYSSGLGAVAWNLLHTTQAKHALVTLGKQGLVTFARPSGEGQNADDRLTSHYLPAMQQHVTDPLGCGDALLATAALTLGVQKQPADASTPLAAAALLGSIAAGIQLTRLGNSPLDADALIAAVSAREAKLARLAS